MHKAFFYTLTLWWVLGLHILCNNWGEPRFSVNVVLLAVLYFGLVQGPWDGQILGLLWGLLVDASFYGLIGANALLFASVGYASGMLRRQLDETKAVTQALFTFGASFLYLFFAYGLDRMFSSVMRPLTWTAILQPFINALFAPVMFWVLRRWSVLWRLAPEET